MAEKHNGVEFDNWTAKEKKPQTRLSILNSANLIN